jgi:hypothetical protein
MTAATYRNRWHDAAVVINLVMQVPVARLLFAAAPKKWVEVTVGGVKIVVFAKRIR